MPVTVDFNRDLMAGGLPEYGSPVGGDTRTAVVHPALRVPEDRDPWLPDCSEQSGV
jgi:hypothetical protein